MPLLDKLGLFERVRLAFQASGWGLAFDSPSDEHPFKITVYKEGETRRLLVYIWNLTHGGGKARPVDEMRIQLTGVEPPLQIQPGRQTLLLGWSEDLGVFAAFDPLRHQQFSTQSPSIQIKLGNLEAAASQGMSFYPRGNGEMAAALTPAALPEHVLQQAAIHNYGDITAEVEVLNAAAAGEEVPYDIMGHLPPERQVTVSTVSRISRESSFRRRVLRAYKNSCAVCTLQLGLIQAAHVVPVHVPGSTDETSNGLALCPTHHLGYDSAALLAVAPDYQVIISSTRATQLGTLGLTGGLDYFSNVLETIALPEQVSERPKPDYLQRGIEVRHFHA